MGPEHYILSLEFVATSNVFFCVKKNTTNCVFSTPLMSYLKGKLPNPNFVKYFTVDNRILFQIFIDDSCFNLNDPFCHLPLPSCKNTFQDKKTLSHSDNKGNLIFYCNFNDEVKTCDNNFASKENHSESF